MNDATLSALREVAAAPRGLHVRDVPRLDELERDGLIRTDGPTVVPSGCGWWTLRAEWSELAPTLEADVRRLAAVIANVGDVAVGEVVPKDAYARRAELERGPAAERALAVVGHRGQSVASISSAAHGGVQLVHRAAFDPQWWSRVLEMPIERAPAFVLERVGPSAAPIAALVPADRSERGDGKSAARSTGRHRSGAALRQALVSGAPGAPRAGRARSQ